MITIFYLLIPAVAAVAAWAAGRRVPMLGRVIALAGTGVAAGHGDRAVDRARRRPGRDRARERHRRGAVPERRHRQVKGRGSRSSASASSWPRTASADPAHAHLRSEPGGGAGLVEEHQDRVGFFHFFLLWTTAGLAGAFMAFDLFLFYFFFEMMLVPMYFLIALWGYERRLYAAVKFFIFTQVGGLLMLIADPGAGLRAQPGHGRVHLRLHGAAAARPCRPATATWLMLGFFAAFAVKLPAVPGAHLAAGRAHRRRRPPAAWCWPGCSSRSGAYGLHPLPGAAVPARRLRLSHAWPWCWA